MLKVKDLKVYYKTNTGNIKAVDGVSFTVNEKEIFGIVGESGCGKSTLANGILRLVSPPCIIESGEVVFKNINLMSLDEEQLRAIRLKRVSYIPQSSMEALNPVMKIEDQIADGIQAHENIDKKEALKMVPPLLEEVGLPIETSKMYPHELSGGMKQRAIIAIAMALRPELLIADEPSTALDVVVQRVVLQFLMDLKEKYGSSLIVITHDIAVLSEISDRIAVMYAGKLVELGPLKDIFKNPLHPYTQALILATPSFEMDKKKGLKGLKGLP
ncbi:MAG: ABC transporter ATP-binding protein, partial [Candidatus Freyarchaeota archaeon]|nr:ABC transporter ATP-binding protein [Candidatus Jordarchaeia archaeon]